MSWKPACGKPGFRLSEVAEGDQRRRIVGDDAGIFDAISARKKPMPAAMPSFRLKGIASISQARSGESDSAKNSTPETNTQPSPSCQLPPSSGTMVKAK